MHDPEYCAKVAEAVGVERFDPSIVYSRGNRLIVNEHGVVFREPEEGVDEIKPFRPDVDWNDAFWVADLAGLFESAWLGKTADGRWAVCDIPVADAVHGDVVRDCGRHAICDAILLISNNRLDKQAVTEQYS